MLNAAVKKLRNLYLDLTIGNKLLLMYLLAFLVPFVFLSLFMYNILYSELMEKRNTDLDHNVSKASQYIENKLENVMATASMVLLDPKLQLYLQEEHKGDSYLEAYHYIEDRFNTVLLLNPGIVSLTLYISNKTLPSDNVTVCYIDRDAAPQPWYETLSKIQGKKVVYLPTTLKENKINPTKNVKENYVFTVITQMQYYLLKHNNTILSMDIRESEIGSFVESYGNDEQMLVTDSSGIVVASADRENLGKPIGTLYSLSSEPSGNEGWLDGYRNGNKVVVRHNLLKNGWRVVGLMTYSNLLHKVNTKLVQLLGVCSAFLLLAIALIFFTSRFWTRRIKTLIRFMKQLEEGDFNIPHIYSGKDEFNEMLGSFSNMSRKIDHLIQEVYIKEIAKTEAELNNLQGLINPHFLYNTLSSISLLARKNNDRDVMHMVNHLSRFYRSALGKGKNLITVEEEISLTRNYLAIQSIRLADQIHAHFYLDETLYAYKTPKVIFQPFVENSINHAIWNQTAVLNIVIRLFREEDTLCLEVVDDGAGFDSRQHGPGSFPAGQSHSGFGIANVSERIRISFGETYGVSICSRRGIGTSVRITLPMLL